MGMSFGTWNIRSLYMACSLKTEASELAKYNLDLVEVHKVRWDYTLFYGNGNDNHHLGTGVFVCNGNVSVQRAEFISDRISYILLRSHWCDILNVHAPTEDKTDDTKDSIYVELEHIFAQYQQYHTKILL
jgi:hypothetical protein